MTKGGLELVCVVLVVGFADVLVVVVGVIASADAVHLEQAQYNPQQMGIVMALVLWMHQSVMFDSDRLQRQPV